MLAVTALVAGTAPSLATDASGSRWESRAQVDPVLSTVGAQLERVLVTARGGVAAAADAVRASGGRVGVELPLVDGVSAVVPAARLSELSSQPGVLGITKDRQAHFEQLSYEDAATASSFATSTQATAAWTSGNAGKGVGIAVLDTGVSEMQDFDGRLVHGPDLSGEGTLVDTFGHGTVMAGVAAGSGAASATAPGGAHTGVAPEATVVAVKVAGRDGAVDVSTILQGLHWVAAHQEQFNIRVLNLSWGTQSSQDPSVDPLNHAVQRLWKQGIVVVVSAGNAGPHAGTVTKPADDPMVLTVGAYDDKGDANPRNDVLPAWTSRGPTAGGLAKPDLIAPGRTLVAVRSAGSTVEQENPRALIGTDYIKGSGSSQSAAVVSGLAALVVAAHPDWTPDQVKHALVSTAEPVASGTAFGQGAGRAQLARALAAAPGPTSWQTGTATGLGSIEASRGGSHVEVVCPGASTPTLLVGEVDARCEAWTGSKWTGSKWTGSKWTGSKWTGSKWTGSKWTGDAWTRSTWTGSSWSGGTWSGSSWSGEAWTGSEVADSAWTGSKWTGSKWTGSKWTGSKWTGSKWTGSKWTSTDGVAPRNGFLTAFWGQRPPAGSTVPGEVSDAP